MEAIAEIPEQAVEPARSDTVEPGALVSMMLSSIRSIDARIDELKSMMRYLSYEGKIEARERVERLIESRFCIVYSLMDIRGATLRYFDFDGNNQSAAKMLSSESYYGKLKRQIR